MRSTATGSAATGRRAGGHGQQRCLRARPATRRRECAAGVNTGERTDAETRHVVGLGAICDLVESIDGGRTKRFSVSEFADLDDGGRVILHDERGFTIGWVGLDPEDATGVGGVRESAGALENHVLNVVLPDEDDGEEHPWDWLAGLARARGLEVSADDLRPLPYRVLFTPAVTALTEPTRP